MKYRPILFSAAMIRALLSDKKTQTRRVMNPQPTRSLPHTAPFAMPSGERATIHHPIGWRWRNSFVADSVGGIGQLAHHSPFSPVGGRLWVRETWRVEELPDGLDGVRFAADDAFVEIANTREASDLWVEANENGKHGSNWRPSIFMPRWASRITLEVTEVRVVRLHDITEEDARAEGIDGNAAIPALINGKPGEVHCFGPDAARKAFAILWDGINGKRAPWLSNPWVWVVSFKRIAQP